MCRALRCAVGALVIATTSHAAAGPVIELVTIGPNHPIDTRFGHILLRVHDEASGRDDSYDYGVAPFHRPGFMLKAILGRADFSLRRSPAQVRFSSYWLQDRDVEAQRLALTDAQRDRLLARLEWNLLPENRDYPYDHVLDNCATRLRDLIDYATDGALRDAAPRIDVHPRYRDDILVAGSGSLLALLGLDLASGENGEQRMTAWERAFLPRYLRDLVAVARNPALGAPLVARSEMLHERQAPPAVGGSVAVGRQLAIAFGATWLVVFGWGAVVWRRALRAGQQSARARVLGRGIGILLVPTSLLFGTLGVISIGLNLSTGYIWAPNQNALLFVPFDFALLVPAIQWSRSARPRLERWMRVYLDTRLVGTLLVLSGALPPQDNGAFAVAVAFVLLGIRLQPPAARE